MATPQERRPAPDHQAALRSAARRLSLVQRGRRSLAQLLDACCALTLDARGLPMDYTPTSRCDGCR